MWNNFLTENYPFENNQNEIDPLLETHWHQFYPFNTVVNEYHENCPVGCLATALGQIMKYWNFPEHPRFSKFIDEINGRKTISEVDYIERLIQKHYESVKENLRNNILNSIGTDLESPTVTLPNDIIVSYSYIESDEIYKINILFDDDIIIRADWEGCVVEAIIGGVGANVSFDLAHTDGTYSYSLNVYDPNVFNVDMDVDA